jgi:hypothetical protein
VVQGALENGNHLSACYVEQFCEGGIEACEGLIIWVLREYTCYQVIPAGEGGGLVDGLDSELVDLKTLVVLINAVEIREQNKIMRGDWEYLRRDRAEHSLPILIRELQIVGALHLYVVALIAAYVFEFCF